MATTNFAAGTLIESTWLNDVDAVVYGDGSDAVSLQSNQVRYTPAGTGAVAATLQAKTRERISIIDFGADPTGVADSSAEIQAALDYAASLILASSGSQLAGTGVEVYFPAGVYLVGTALTITEHGIGIVGDVGKGTVLTGDNIILNIGDYTNTKRISKVSIKNISFIASNTANATAAVKLYRTSRTSFEECNFYTFAIGIDCYRASTTNIDHCICYQALRTAQATAWIRCQGTDETATTLETYTPGGGMHVTDCEIRGTTNLGTVDMTAGILLHSVDGFYMTQTHFTGCVYSVHIAPDGSAENHYIADIMLNNCYFDEPSEVVTNPRNVYITGTVKESITMADASTQSSNYQSIRIVNCYFRGADFAFRNLEIAVTDGDSWWDYKQLKDILISNSTFRQSPSAYLVEYSLHHYPEQ